MSTPDVRTGEVELLIGGMTCASCAARVEKKLNRMDGVSATVNYATEKARVTVRRDVTTRRPDRHGGESRLHAALPPAREATEPRRRGARQGPSPAAACGRPPRYRAGRGMAMVPVAAVALAVALD
jgi:Cu+-exporting ATPase